MGNPIYDKRLCRVVYYIMFGLKDQEYLKTEYKSGGIIFHIRTKDHKLRYSQCGGKDVVKKGVIEREFRTQPIGL